MAMPVLSLRLDAALLNQLDELSAATERDRLYHVKRALSRYLEDEAWHVESIREGLEDAKSGNLTELKDVKSKWVSRARNRLNQQSAK